MPEGAANLSDTLPAATPVRYAQAEAVPSTMPCARVGEQWGAEGKQLVGRGVLQFGSDPAKGGVGVATGVGVGAPGVGVEPDNRGGPVDRAGRR